MLVAEAAQRLEPFERTLELRHVHHAPGDDVASRRGAERREVPTEDRGPRLDRVVRLRLLDRDEPALGTRVPERRLVVVQDVRAHPCAAPGAARIDAGEPVLALEMRERFLRGHGTCRGERAHRRREALRGGRLPRKVRLAERRAEERVVAPCDEVQRLPHHGRLDDGGARELALERLAPEARRARPDADVRRRRPLRLHPDQALDHRRRREPLPLQQELTRERRAVQLAQREDALGHASTLACYSCTRR